MSRVKNQRQMVLAHLESGSSITSLEALTKFGCLRLAARIEELRRMGFSIGKEMVPVESGARVAEYFLNREEKMEVA